MVYTELKQVFQELKRTSPREDLTAHIIFTEDSFATLYPLLSRTYLVSSDNKGFRPHMFSNSIFAYCLDKTSDQGARLDWYMEEEGNSGGWKVEDCYILEQMRDTAAIPNYSRTMQIDGTAFYFFSDTCIQVREAHEKDTIHLEPVRGDQTVCGEWVELSIDRVYGYCTLLERHLNSQVNRNPNNTPLPCGEV